MTAHIPQANGGVDIANFLTKQYRPPHPPTCALKFISVAVVEEEDERTRRMATDASVPKNACPPMERLYKVQQYRLLGRDHLDESPSFTLFTHH
jgi:hypothetical protein